MNVSRKDMRKALEDYERQVQITGRSTTLEMHLYQALDSLLRSGLPVDHERLDYVESMLEEVALLAPANAPDDPLYDNGVAGKAFEVDEVYRDQRGRIATISGTISGTEKLVMERRGEPEYVLANRSPYILGEW